MELWTIFLLGIFLAVALNRIPLYSDKHVVFWIIFFKNGVLLLCISDHGLRGYALQVPYTLPLQGYTSDLFPCLFTKSFAEAKKMPSNTRGRSTMFGQKLGRKNTDKTGTI